MSEAEKPILKRREAVEPSIDHLKAGHRMRRNFLKGALGDATRPILAEAGFNTCWVMRRLVVSWRRIWSRVPLLLDQYRLDARLNLDAAAG